MMEDSILRRIQTAELKIMDEIHRLCVLHRIEYSLAYGSLLGAVRHHGFIPWDDDMDIVMKRDQFIRFKAVCRMDMSDEFFFQDETTDPGFDLPCIAKVRLNGTRMVEACYRRRKMHQGAWVDIFIYEPFDGSQKKLIAAKNRYRIWKNKYLFWYKLIHKNFFGKIVLLWNEIVPFYTAKVAKRKLLKQIEEIRNTNGCYYLDVCGSQKQAFASADLGSLVLCSFEGREYFRYANYGLILQQLYGDYMQLPSEDKRNTSHVFSDIFLPDL